MEQEDDMSSMTNRSDVSKTGHHVQSTNPATTVTQMDTAIEEPRPVPNIGSSTVGTQQLSAGDLEALANIQEELDRMAQAPTTISNQPDGHDEEQGVVGIQEAVTGSSKPYTV